AEHPELAGERANPLEAVEGAAAMEIDQRHRIRRPDRISDRLYAFDAVDQPFEAFGAVSPAVHAPWSSACAAAPLPRAARAEKAIAAVPPAKASRRFTPPPDRAASGCP